MVAKTYSLYSQVVLNLSGKTGGIKQDIVAPFVVFTFAIVKA